jgi:hypothetical protein
MFGHIKERIKIHRGLDKKSEEKSGKIFVEKLGAKVRKKPPIFLIMPLFRANFWDHEIQFRRQQILFFKIYNS